MFKRTKSLISIILTIALLGATLFTSVSATAAEETLTGLELYTSEEYLVDSTSDGTSSDVNVDNTYGDVIQVPSARWATYAKTVGDSDGYYTIGDGVLTVSFDQRMGSTNTDHWFNLNIASEDASSKADGLRGTNRMVCGYSVNGTIGIGLIGGADWLGTTFTATAKAYPSAGAWHHYDYVVDFVNKTMTIFIDGTQVAKSSVPDARLTQVTGFDIGGRDNGAIGNYYDNFDVYFVPAADLTEDNSNLAGYTAGTYLVDSTTDCINSEGTTTSFWSGGIATGGLNTFAQYVTSEGFWNAAAPNAKIVDISGTDSHGKVISMPASDRWYTYGKLLGSETESGYYGIGDGILTVSFERKMGSTNTDHWFNLHLDNSLIVAGGDTMRGSNRMVCGYSGNATMGIGLINGADWLGTTFTATAKACPADAAWHQYDYVIDLINLTMTIYIDGEQFATANVPQERLATIYGFDIGGRNYATDTIDYYDNMAVYFVPESELPGADSDSEAAPYIKTKNRIGSSDASVASDTAFWNLQMTAQHEDIGGTHGSVVKMPKDFRWTGYAKKVGDTKGYYGAGDGAVTFSFDHYTDTTKINHWFNAINVNVDTLGAEFRYDAGKIIGQRQDTGVYSAGDNGNNTDDWHVNTWEQSSINGTIITDSESNPTWAHFDYVLDLVHNTITVYIDGVKTLSAPVPSTMIEKVYGIQLAGAQYGGVEYYDNFALYFTPADEMPENEAEDYVKGKNRVDWSYAANLDGAYFDGGFWNYKSSISYGVNANPLYKNVVVPDTDGGYLVKMVGGDNGYEHNQGRMTFSFDKYETYSENRELEIRAVVNETSAADALVAISTDYVTLFEHQSSANSEGWHHYDVVADLVGDKVMVFVDGVLKTTTNMKLPSIYAIGIYTKNIDGDTTNYCLDNFNLYWSIDGILSVSDVKLTDASGNKIANTSGITTTTDLKAVATISNDTNSPKTYMLSYAVYNGDEMSDMLFVQTQVDPYTTADPYIDFKVSNTDGLTIKVFVWDGISTMSPYVNNATVTAPVQ